MDINYKKIFFSSIEIVKFETKIKTMVDSILTFIKYDVSIMPAEVNQKNLSSKKNNQYKAWLTNAPQMTIVKLITNVVANPEGKINAKKGILNIILNNRQRKVTIKHKEDIFKEDIEVIEKILTKLMFDYFEPKAIESKQIREQNMVQVQENQKSILNNINQHIRSNKNAGYKK